MPTTARLFNGRLQNNDSLKHITVDKYDNLLLITTYKQHSLPNNFIQQFSFSGDYIYWRQRSGKKTIWKSLKGELLDKLVINDQNSKYLLKFSDRQNIGFFLDMANTRQYVRSIVANKKVLNLFAYTCSFSVVSLNAGATHVTNVDMKSTFLDWGRKNHQLNGDDLRQVSFLKHNILKSLNGYVKRGPFDLIICDPPSFQQGGFKLEQDYPKIIRKIHQMLSPQGEALLCCNDPLFSREQFVQLIKTHGTNLQITGEVENPQHFDSLKVIKVRSIS